MDDIKFVNKTNKFLNGKFVLGDRSKGWDCLNSLAEFFDSMGVSFPRQFKDWNEQNYPKRWERGEGMETFREFLLSLGRPIDLNYLRPGDVIIFEKEYEGKPVVSAGLYLGSNHFQAIHNKLGVIRLPLWFFKSAIIGARRLVE